LPPEPVGGYYDYVFNRRILLGERMSKADKQNR